MNIQIEDYFGNDVLKLSYCLLDKVITEKRVKAVSDIAVACGYNFADIDSDEDDIQYIRLQEVNVDNSEEDEKNNLTELVNKLNMEFL